MTSPLKQEFEYYLAHQDELVKLYEGRFVVIHGQAVVGNYATEDEAIAAGEKSSPLGTFLVQKVERGTSSYTQTFHSRVSFA